MSHSRLLTSALAVICAGSIASANSKTPTPKSVANANPAESTVAETSSVNLSLDQKNGQPLTLEHSIEIGVHNATDVLKSENELMFNGARLLQAYGQFLPNAVASGQYGAYRGSTYTTVAVPTLTSGRGANAGWALTTDLNIFNGFADFANFRSSTLKRSAADLTVKRAKQQISLDVAQSFLQVVLDQKLVDIAVKNLQASKERERLLKGQTDVGARNLSDLFRQQAQTSLDESSLLSAQNRIRTDQVYLLRRLRLDVNAPYHFVEPSLSEAVVGTKGNQSSKGEDRLVNEGLDHRFDLKASNDQANAIQWDVHTAYANYFPKIDAVAGMNSVGHRLWNQNVSGVGAPPLVPYAGFDDSIGDQLRHQVEYTVGIQLTWNIFDRFYTNETVQRARADSKNAAIDAEDRRLQVQGDVKQAYGDYITSVQQMESSRKGLEAAHKAYDVMSGRYEVGAASFLDLIVSQTTLVQAESQRAQAVINYELQDRTLEFATGTLSVPE